MSEPSNQIIYQTLLDQNKTLGRIEAKQDAQGKILDDLVPRVQAVEDTQNKYKWGIRGAFAVGGLAHAGTVWAFIKGIIA